MGMDVTIYVEGDVDDEHLDAAIDFFERRVAIADTAWTSGRVLVRYDAGWEDEPQPRIELRSAARYYGEEYERGPWPDIYAAIRAMQTQFPDRTVFYGSDSSEYGEPCTPELLEDIWKHWLGPSGDAYRGGPAAAVHRAQGREE